MRCLMFRTDSYRNLLTKYNWSPIAFLLVDIAFTWSLLTRFTCHFYHIVPYLRMHDGYVSSIIDIIYDPTSSFIPFHLTR